MAKTYKILVNDGKGTDIKPVSVVQGASANGDPVRMTAKRGWRFELQDDLKGKGLGPDQVRLKRIGKNLGLMFDGSTNPDVVIEDYYAENEDKDKDNGMPMIVGQAENGGIYEYVPQDPAASSMASELKEGNTPVILALGGGPLAGDFVLAGLPLIAAAGGGIGGLLAGGAALVAAAAAGGGGGGGGGTPAVVTATVAPTVAIDTDVNNDGYVNKTEVGGKTTYAAKTALPSTAVAGDTITVTDGTTTKTHVLTATDITNKFVTDTFELPTEGSTINVSAKMTSAATGVSSANATDTAKLDTSAFVDPITPEPFTPTDPTKSGLRVTINSDVNNDGILSNADMATADLVKATIALTADSAVGDVLTVTATGNTTRTITLTAADIAAKQVVLKGLTAPAQGSTIIVTATIQDAASNSSPSTATDSAKVDTTIPGVTILNDENNDGFINKVESDKTTGVSVKIEVPSGAGAGNTIKVSNGTTTINHSLTQAEVDAKSFTLTNAFVKPAEGATITVTAVLGNNTTGGSDSAKLDTSKFIDPVNPDPINPVDPTKSGLRVTINSDENNDGFLSNFDLASADLVKATIALTTDAAVGDLLTVAITGNTTRSIILTAAHIAEKQVVLTGLTAPVNGDTITVTATLQDVAGNSTPAVAFDSARVNTAMPGVMITTDINNDGLINSAELNGATTVAVRIEVPKTALIGDPVTVTDGITTISHVLTETDVRDKVFTETFAKPAEGANITVTASYGGTTGTDNAKLDATAPTNANVGLGVSINTDGNNDAFVTGAELGTSATFNSRATFDKLKVEVGDQIDFTFKNGSGTPETVRRVLTATDIENGFVDKTFAKPVENTMQTVTVNFVDKAGNPATDTNTTTNPKLTDNATLDVTAPTNEDVDLGVRIITDAGSNGGDGIVSNAELNAQRDVNNTGDTANFISRATFTSSKAIVGHKIIFTAKNGTTDLEAQTITLTQADVDRGFVEVKFAKPSEGQTQTVTAMYADAAGNADTTGAPTDFASLDTVVTTLAVEVITDGANGGANDGFVNNTEIGNNTKYNVEARFESDKVEIGDKVQFTVGSTVTEVAIDQTMKTAGKVALMFDAPTTNGASFNVKVVIKDAVGNSAEAQDTVVRNKLIAVNDTAEVRAPTSSTPTTTPAANVITNDADPQFLPNPASPASLQVFVSGIKLSSASAFSAISNNIAGQFGSLKIDANGSYTYTVSNTTAVEALGANDSPVETFVYQVTDNVGNVSTATLAITVKGVNDKASHTLQDSLLLRINNSNTNPLIGESNALLITDNDAGESALSSVAATGSTPFTGSFGTLTMTQSSHTATQTGYSYSYSKNASSGISDTTRHDLFTFNTQDGTDSVTFDIQLLNTSGVAATKNLYQTGSTVGLKIATATTSTEDTLKLVGSQMTFDFTGTAATTDIKSIETIDITGTGNNTIKLDLNSLTQADLSGGVHKLFIKGNTGDTVLFNLDNTPTAIAHDAAAVTVNGSDYWVYHVGSGTDELLVQTTINNITVNG
jgi:VCBS repeat-containing protein